MLQRLAIMIILAIVASPLWADELIRRVVSDGSVAETWTVTDGKSSEAAIDPSRFDDRPLPGDRVMPLSDAATIDDQGCDDHEYEEDLRREDYLEQLDDECDDQSVSKPHLESRYRTDLCNGLRQEVTLSNGARADCLSPTHAIEIDFTEKWAEALGQSLLYAAATDLKPAIYLICRDAERKCLAHRLRLDEAIEAWKLPVEVWEVEG